MNKVQIRNLLLGGLFGLLIGLLFSNMFGGFLGVFFQGHPNLLISQQLAGALICGFFQQLCANWACRENIVENIFGVPPVTPKNKIFGKNILNATRRETGATSTLSYCSNI
jgi:hypothetical protein